MNNSPKISIVTPSFNQAQFLERTILSILNQNYPNLEYLIIDGGSTDGSVDIIKKYEKYLAYWVSEPDNGQTDAIKKGFEKSTGNILAWLNSDDIYLSGTLHKAANFFQEYIDTDLIFGNIYLIDENDNSIDELRFTDFDFETLIFEGGNLHQTGTFWKRDFYEKVGSINPRYEFSMDIDLFCRMGKLGKFTHINHYLAAFRIHDYSKSSTSKQKMREENLEIFHRYIKKNASNEYLLYKKNYYRLKRYFKYIKQGDLDYLIKKIRRRTLTNKK